jgi:hypothetical protein
VRLNDAYNDYRAAIIETVVAIWQPEKLWEDPVLIEQAEVADGVHAMVTLEPPITIEFQTATHDEATFTFTVGIKVAAVSGEPVAAELMPRLFELREALQEQPTFAGSGYLPIVRSISYDPLLQDNYHIYGSLTFEVRAAVERKEP